MRTRGERNASHEPTIEDACEYVVQQDLRPLELVSVIFFAELVLKTVAFTQNGGHEVIVLELEQLLRVNAVAEVLPLSETLHQGNVPSVVLDQNLCSISELGERTLGLTAGFWATVL